jgi:hypothetical protein
MFTSQDLPQQLTYHNLTCLTRDMPGLATGLPLSLLHPKPPPSGYPSVTGGLRIPLEEFFLSWAPARDLGIP